MSNSHVCIFIGHREHAAGESAMENGAVVPFERVWVLLDLQMIVLSAFAPSATFLFATKVP